MAVDAEVKVVPWEIFLNVGHGIFRLSQHAERDHVKLGNGRPHIGSTGSGFFRIDPLFHRLNFLDLRKLVSLAISSFNFVKFH